MIRRLQAIRAMIILTYARVAGRLRTRLETKDRVVENKPEWSVAYFEEKCGNDDLCERGMMRDYMAMALISCNRACK